jgi:RNA polymerase sigma-70 factor (ECF subfamily)
MTIAAGNDSALVAALRAGDERAFAALVDEFGASMRRFALSIVHDAALADDVVQEAWLGVLRGLDRFEGRSSLKTWLFRIVANTAKTRAERESRETRGVVAAAIEQLPPAQRLVISLRDVEGWSAEEVCNVLELSETNQRVLLHRGRSRVRAALEQYLETA